MSGVFLIEIKTHAIYAMREGDRRRYYATNYFNELHRGFNLKTDYRHLSKIIAMSNAFNLKDDIPEVKVFVETLIEKYDYRLDIQSYDAVDLIEVNDVYEF